MQQLIYAAVLTAFSVLCVCGAEPRNITLHKPKCSRNGKATARLDMVADFMNQAKELYPDCIDEELDCGKKEKSLALLDFASSLITQVKENFPTCPEYPEQQKKPMDCSEILQSGKNKSGVYTIWPRSRITSNESITVYCDMEIDGGGWTVIQRRGNFSTPKDYFFKDWESYKIGFGNVEEEFWLGNDNIYAISNQVKTRIRFDLKDAEGISGYAQYNNFWIEEEKFQYNLYIGGYEGNVGDAMTAHSNKKFTTKDRDNDNYKGENCAEREQGAWWYNNCAYANLNALYQPGVENRTGIYWFQWRKTRGLSGVEIKVRSERI